MKQATTVINIVLSLCLLGTTFALQGCSLFLDGQSTFYVERFIEHGSQKHIIYNQHGGTLEAWIKPDFVAFNHHHSINNGVILQTGVVWSSHLTKSYALSFNYTSRTVQAEIWELSGSFHSKHEWFLTTISSITTNNGEWMHVAFHTSSNQLFLNGHLQVTHSTHERIAGKFQGPPHRFAIGTYFTGQIDEVRIWNTTRKISTHPQEVDCITTDKRDLLLSMDFDECTGIPIDTSESRACGRMGSTKRCAISRGDDVNRPVSFRLSTTMKNFTKAHRNHRYTVDYSPVVYGFGAPVKKIKCFGVSANVSIQCPYIDDGRKCDEGNDHNKPDHNGGKDHHHGDGGGGQDHHHGDGGGGGHGDDDSDSSASGSSCSIGFFIFITTVLCAVFACVRCRMNRRRAAAQRAGFSSLHPTNVSSGVNMEENEGYPGVVYYPVAQTLDQQQRQQFHAQPMMMAQYMHPYLPQHQLQQLVFTAPPDHDQQQPAQEWDKE